MPGLMTAGDARDLLGSTGARAERMEPGAWSRVRAYGSKAQVKCSPTCFARSRASRVSRWRAWRGLEHSPRLTRGGMSCSGIACRKSANSEGITSSGQPWRKGCVEALQLAYLVQGGAASAFAARRFPDLAYGHQAGQVADDDPEPAAVDRHARGLELLAGFGYGPAMGAA